MTDSRPGARSGTSSGAVSMGTNGEGAGARDANAATDTGATNGSGEPSAGSCPVIGEDETGEIAPGREVAALVGGMRLETGEAETVAATGAAEVGREDLSVEADMPGMLVPLAAFLPGPRAFFGSLGLTPTPPRLFGR